MGTKSVKAKSDKTSAPKMARPRSGIDRDQIAQRAYERYLARGGAHGNDLEDWLMAERGTRKMLVSDNGTELTSTAILRLPTITRSPGIQRPGASGGRDPPVLWLGARPALRGSGLAELHAPLV